MWILRKYITSELAKYFFMSIAVFTFVLLVGNMLKLADMIINKGVNILYVARLFLYMIPWLLSYAIPMSALTATLITFGRLSNDNEIVAMKASGISQFKIAAPALACGLFLSLISIPLNDQLLPMAHYASRSTIKEIGIKSPTAYIEPGTFIKDFKGYIIFVYEINGNTLKNIRIYQPQPNRPTRTIIASSGEFIPIPNQEAVKLKLVNGISDEPDPRNPAQFYKLNFKTYYMTLNLDADKAKREKLKKKVKEMTFKELKNELANLTVNIGIDTIPILTEMHNKLAMSFAALAFVLIGLPLGIVGKRGETSVGFGMSLGVIIIYWILLAAGNAVALKGILPPWICMWFPNIVVMSVGAALCVKVLRE